jgi:hypothetical protein
MLERLHVPHRGPEPHAAGILPRDLHRPGRQSPPDALHPAASATGIEAELREIGTEGKN